MSHACHRFQKCYKALTFCSLLTRCTIPCPCHGKRYLNVQKCSEPISFYTFDFEMCFAPHLRALFRHHNFQKWSEHGVLCTFWLGHVLRATTACTFSSSQLPKVVRTWCVLYILTWTCASRHNGVHFFIISTSKRGPNLFFFVHFDLDMCFAPQRRALFHRLNIQKWSEHPPCIALYEVDILCAYKVGFRSPLYTRPWGIKACSAQETCALGPGTWLYTTTRKRLNMRQCFL